MYIIRQTACFIKIILAILLVLTGNGFANDDVLRDHNDDLLVFIVNQDNVLVYNKVGDDVPLPKNLSLAESYAASAIDFDKQKLLLSEIQITESGELINQIGWVNSQYILGRWNYRTQQFLPRKKSMAIYEAPASIEANRTINDHPNTLPFRILFKQEGERVKTTKAPGIDSVHGQIQYGFVWYYVYDVQTVDGELYYLIGNKRSLFEIAPDSSIDTATKDEITNNLLGWVKSEHFIIWPTNLVFRKVVLFQRAELINYEETLRTFTSKFDKSLKVGLNRTYKNVSRLIVQAILLGIAKITDDEETDELFTDQEALKKAVSALISRIHSQDSLRLADLLGYQTVLPDQKGMNESLLSMPLKEIITVPRNAAKRKKHIQKIKKAIRQVQTKISCLDKVITGNKAPNNPNRCRAYPSSEKDWRYFHPVSGDSYYYVPFQFIP